MNATAYHSQGWRLPAVSSREYYNRIENGKTQLTESLKKETQKQIELEEQTASLSEEIRKMEQEMIGAKKWVELIKENAVPKELTATLLNIMIEKILIHAPEIDDKSERTQEIEIYYRFIGKID